MTTEAEARVMKLQAPPEAERPGGIDPESQREHGPADTLVSDLHTPGQWNVLKLKLQSFGHLMQRANALEKTLTLGKTEGRRRRG